MAFNYLPNEIKEKIFFYAIDYTPALRMVSKLWCETTSYREFNEWISFKDLVRRGDVDLLIDLHKRKKKDYNCSLLIYAAFYGREELCHLAKRWGESDFEGMLYAAKQGGHRNICQIARAWGAEGIDDLTPDLVVIGYEKLPPTSSFWRSCDLEGAHYEDCEYLQPILKEWELNDEILLSVIKNNQKTGNTYIKINKWVEGDDWENTLINSETKYIWSYGDMIVTY